MPDPKLPAGEEPESEQGDHGAALAKTFQQIEDEQPLIGESPGQPDGKDGVAGQK
jgi:hypothetical protein